jgi:hypothetical protein
MRALALLSKCAFITGKVFSLMAPRLIGLFFESTLLSGTRRHTKCSVASFTKFSNPFSILPELLVLVPPLPPSISMPPKDGRGCAVCCCMCLLYASAHCCSFLFLTKVKTISLLFHHLGLRLVFSCMWWGFYRLAGMCRACMTSTMVAPCVILQALLCHLCVSDWLVCVIVNQL